MLYGRYLFTIYQESLIGHKNRTTRFGVFFWTGKQMYGVIVRSSRYLVQLYGSTIAKLVRHHNRNNKKNYRSTG